MDSVTELMAATIELQPAELRLNDDDAGVHGFSNVLGFAPAAHVHEVYTNPSFPRLPRRMEDVGRRGNNGRGYEQFSVVATSGGNAFSNLERLLARLVVQKLDNRSQIEKAFLPVLYSEL